MTRVVLVTGASSGIGRACAVQLAIDGDHVYGTSRRVAVDAPPGVTMLPMDVTDEESIAAGVARILNTDGRIDVVINNAGTGIGGAIEDTTIADAKALFDTNFFGALRVCHAVLPTMRAQQAGTIINISSLAGRIGLPFQGMYSATKFALEGLTEALRMEVRPFRIRVVLIEPGDFRTGFTSNRRLTAPPDSPYQERMQRALHVAEADEMNGAEPEMVARLVERILRTPSPRVRYTVGGASQRMAAGLKRVFPSRVFEWGLRHYYRIQH